ncbi:type II secretion system F family protein [Nocardia harenae]|uniref:type II secretion system F family protein n=1 Tax=Nocardia harenae TaxID=358707 RepID=UPI00082A898A|nr:type II secretion system F family protein [Nocardia harenae]
MTAALTPAPLLLLALALLAAPPPPPVLRRWHTPAAGPEPESESAADPLAGASVFDLLAACLRAGLPMANAARAVAPTAPPAVAGALRRAAELLGLGAEASTAWHRAATECANRPGAEEIDALARLARRSARSGASLATAVTELARHRRAAVEDTAAARAERAGVLIAGPLGLCFLPAFLCLGIVPVVIGLAGQVLGNGLL